MEIRAKVLTANAESRINKQTGEAMDWLDVFVLDLSNGRDTYHITIWEDYQELQMQLLPNVEIHVILSGVKADNYKNVNLRAKAEDFKIEKDAMTALKEMEAQLKGKQQKISA